MTVERAALGAANGSALGASEGLRVGAAIGESLGVTVEGVPLGEDVIELEVQTP